MVENMEERREKRGENDSLYNCGQVISLGLNFFLYKMGVIIVHIAQDFVRIKLTDSICLNQFWEHRNTQKNVNSYYIIEGEIE